MFYDDPAVHYDAPGVYYDGFLPPIPKKGRMPDIALNLSKMSVEEVLQFATTLHTGMVAQAATFTTPNPSPAAFQTLLTDATTANNGYEAGKASTASLLGTRDVKIDALKGGIKQWSFYTQNTSPDPTKWQAVGFSLKGQSVPVGPLGQVLNLVITAGDNEGTLDAAWDPLKGANSYEVQISVDPVSPTSWQPKLTAGKSTVTITGLTSGARMWVKVRGVGANNSLGVWSDPAVKTVP
jgi:hypothetical protein